MPLLVILLLRALVNVPRRRYRWWLMPRCVGVHSSCCPLSQLRGRVLGFEVLYAWFYVSQSRLRCDANMVEDAELPRTSRLSFLSSLTDIPSRSVGTRNVESFESKEEELCCCCCYFYRFLPCYRIRSVCSSSSFSCN